MSQTVRPPILPAADLPPSCRLLSNPVDRRREFLSGSTFAQFIEEAERQREHWRAVVRRAAVSPDALRRVRTLHGAWHLLVLTEDWCSDGVHTLPFLARLSQLTLNLDLRVLGRDRHPALMDEHKSGHARAIPVVMILDDECIERGWWASRPSELQALIDGPWHRLPPRERELAKRRWHARDRGASALEEIISLLEHLDASMGALPASFDG
ncbi:MAG TPA: thioredoxin family protein [Gemmatimonadaceae bacterium]